VANAYSLVTINKPLPHAVSKTSTQNGKFHFVLWAHNCQYHISRNKGSKCIAVLFFFFLVCHRCHPELKVLYVVSRRLCHKLTCPDRYLFRLNCSVEGIRSARSVWDTWTELLTWFTQWLWPNWLTDCPDGPTSLVAVTEWMIDATDLTDCFGWSNWLVSWLSSVTLT
jgi:hypothetical protein